jgi:hypothetical protein
VRQGHEGKMLWTKQGGRRARGNSTRLIDNGHSEAIVMH